MLVFLKSLLSEFRTSKSLYFQARQSNLTWPHFTPTNQTRQPNQQADGGPKWSRFEKIWHLDGWSFEIWVQDLQKFWDSAQRFAKLSRFRVRVVGAGGVCSEIRALKHPSRVAAVPPPPREPPTPLRDVSFVFPSFPSLTEETSSSQTISHPLYRSILLWDRDHTCSDDGSVGPILSPASE